MAHLIEYNLARNETFNSCGKHVFKITPEEQLRRFLVLGTAKGTMYINESNLTQINLEALEFLLKDESKHETILSIIKDYVVRTFKRDYLVYVLARCCCFKDNTEFRRNAYELLGLVCTIPTHLFQFLEFYEFLYRKFNNSTGWNQVHKSYMMHWYMSKTPKELAYHITKYKNRHGWTHKDVLRLLHINPHYTATDIQFILRYVVKGDFEPCCDDEESKTIIYLKDYHKLLHSSDPKEAVQLIRQHKFVREHVPTHLQKNADVMNELTQQMPLLALIRCLNRLTAVGVFDKHPDTLQKVLDKLSSPEVIQTSKIQPMNFLIAYNTYGTGKGDLGKLTWIPNDDIENALEAAFYTSFKNTTAIKKRFLIALDVSSSMGYCNVCGLQTMTAALVSSAMAMIFAKTEPHCDFVGFSDELTPINVQAHNNLKELMHYTSCLNFGSTDISLPMTWAQDNNKIYEVIIIFTDSETNCNVIRPADALRNYRTKIGVDVKLIVIALSSNNFSVADPEDKGMLDIAGFDSNTPLIINEFVQNL